MAKKSVVFSVKGDDAVSGYSISVNSDTVRVVNGKGSRELETGVEHTLGWLFTGNEGGKLTIKGKAGDIQVVKVEDEIPQAETEGFGDKYFTID